MRAHILVLPFLGIGTSRTAAAGRFVFSANGWHGHCEKSSSEVGGYGHAVQTLGLSWYSQLLQLCTDLDFALNFPLEAGQ
mmetsp:Transcript_74446/g.213396  ORF Transcript_74446/g.213396 Transcript_74446/m.213396 type:complete len:80 (+) Transcript_74446:739-978(+)